MKTADPRQLRSLLRNILLVSAIGLQGCTPAGNSPSATTGPGMQPASDTSSSNNPPTAASVADLTAPTAVTPSAYAPPNAAQLIQLLAPVAVFPDTLVAQVLAASSYPDQIGEAYAWYQHNNGLKGAALQNAIDQQSWDPSVKAITTFPDVLHQMASNSQWTTALGEAYVNDPSDVMNAIQSLRQQALACNNLKSNKYLTVKTVAKDTAPQAEPFDYGNAPPTYAGPPVIPPPPQVIEIEPAQPDYVYVPQYDPAVFYGAPIAPWPGYAYAWPAPVYAGPLFGAFAFGVGIAIDFGHPWGWGRWGVHWGHGFGGPYHGFRGPGVAFNNHPFVSHSSTVTNRFAHGDPGRNGFDHEGRAPNASMNRAANFNSMSTPRFSSAMAAHGNTFQTGHTPLATHALRPGALASSRYAPPSVARANANNFAAQRAGNAQFAHAQSASMRGNAANSPRYSTPNMQRAYTSHPAQRAFANAPRMQQHAPQVSRGATHSSSGAHVGRTAQTHHH